MATHIFKGEETKLYSFGDMADRAGVTPNALKAWMSRRPDMPEPTLQLIVKQTTTRLWTPEDADVIEAARQEGGRTFKSPKAGPKPAPAPKGKKGKKGKK